MTHVMQTLGMFLLIT